MSDAKVFYYMRGNDVVGPVKFSNIERAVISRLFDYNTLIHSGEGGWITFNQYCKEHPEKLSLNWLTEESPPTQVSSAARICDAMAIISLVVSIVCALATDNYYILAGGATGFAAWLVIGAIRSVKKFL